MNVHEYAVNCTVLQGMIKKKQRQVMVRNIKLRFNIFSWFNNTCSTVAMPAMVSAGEG